MRLPRISGKQTVEALLRAGFTVHRVRGSHYILKHPETGLGG
ncbi:type II toxin-antitoxin system HicA family toxin [Chloroflexota bacterium]